MKKRIGDKMKEELREGSEMELQVFAKGAKGEGISRFGDIVVLIKNAKIRVGNRYNVKVIKVHRTFVDAELNGAGNQLVGNSVLIL